MRSQLPRTAAVLLAIASGLPLSACDGGRGDSTLQADRGADTAPAAVQAPAATPPSPSSSTQQMPDVDPENLAATLEYDSATKTVKFPIIAGLTSANNLWNFNGYANGEMTITVPVGSTVEMPFYNLDGRFPHSFGITADTPKKLPAEPGDAAFAGALTRRYEAGLRTGETDIVRFTADKAGAYLIVCGVPGHTVAGMWVHFRVSAKAKRPAVETR